MKNQLKKLLLLSLVVAIVAINVFFLTLMFAKTTVVIYDTNDFEVISANIGDDKVLVQAVNGSERFEGISKTTLSPGQPVTLRYTYRLKEYTNETAFVRGHYQPKKVEVVPISPSNRAR